MTEVESVGTTTHVSTKVPTRASILANRSKDVRELDLPTGKIRIALIRAHKLVGNVRIPHDQVLGAARDEGFEDASEEIFSHLTQENLGLPEGDEVYIGMPISSGESRFKLFRITSDGKSNYGEIIPVTAHPHANLCEPHWLYAFKLPDENEKE